MFATWMIWFMSMATGVLFFLAFHCATSSRRCEYPEASIYEKVVFTLFGAGFGILTEMCWNLDYRTDFPIGSWALMIVGFLATYTIVAVKSETFRSHHVPRLILNRLYGPLACV